MLACFEEEVPSSLDATYHEPPQMIERLKNKYTYKRTRNGYSRAHAAVTRLLKPISAATLMTVRTSVEVSDEISSHWLPTRLVSIGALLRRYSPSPHSLLRLISHVPDLAHYLALPCESCQPYTTIFRIQGDKVGS
jgi:hypothetical protein